MEFDAETGAQIIRDDQSIVTSVLYSQKPQMLVPGKTARAAAENYLRTYGSVLGLDKSELAALGQPAQGHLSDRGVQYRFVQEKTHFKMSTVVFEQTYLGLPIWQAGVAVQLKRVPAPKNPAARILHRARHHLVSRTIKAPHMYQVISCQSTRHSEVSIDGDESRAAKVARLNAAITRIKETLEPRELARQLGITQTDSAYDSSSLTISHERTVIYRYRATDRVQGFARPATSQEESPNPNALQLPSVSNAVAEDSHHVVAAVYFDLSLKRRKKTHWVALVDVDTLSVLYVEPFAASLAAHATQTVKGKVFRLDPKTKCDGPDPGDDGQKADKLNQLRDLVALPNLKATSPQKLSGSNVRVDNFDFPDSSEFDPPTKPAGADFNFEVYSNDFAAVNAYYHCDRFFGLMESLGFSRTSYFPGTKFPIHVDHRGMPLGVDENGVGAECRARTKPNNDDVTVGISEVVFALAAEGADPPIGIACDWRIVLHEIGGHGTLLNQIYSTQFKFAHSVGDSLAAILNDPESKADDRGLTFPWLHNSITRRHDRKANVGGWGWGGSKDTPANNRLLQEQILSSTHFRLYCAIGGGNTTSVDVRSTAAETTVYLILQAIKSLSPTTSPAKAADWMRTLVAANHEDWPVKNYAGGAYGKVIAWAFEEQNLFGGRPESGVDVYIDDGRHGEYNYQKDWASCPAIWNRRAADGLQGHQAPVPNVVNFAYVTIKNRGTQKATSVSVRAFQNTSQTKRDWPTNWKATKTAQCSAADVPKEPAEVKVGPFQWIPSAGNNYLLMAVTAHLDEDNLHFFSVHEPIPDWRLVPHDNNLGMRKM